MTQLNPETVNRIQENLIAYFRIYAGLPGTTFVENAQVTWNAGPPGSMVLRTRLAPDRKDRRVRRHLAVGGFNHPEPAATGH